MTAVEVKRCVEPQDLGLLHVAAAGKWKTHGHEVPPKGYYSIPGGAVMRCTGDLNWKPYPEVADVSPLCAYATTREYPMHWRHRAMVRTEMEPIISVAQ